MAGTTNSPPPAGSQPSSTPAPAQKRTWWRWIIYALVLLAINYALVALLVLGPTTQRVTIPYTLFNQQVQASNVAEITAQGDQIQGRFTQSVSRMGRRWASPISSRRMTATTTTRAILRGRIIGAIGGRAAEEVVYGTRTTGAESDMQQATTIARQMVTRWGMSDKLGPVTLATSTDGQVGQPETDAGLTGWRPYSEDTARLIDAEIRRVLDQSYAEAFRLLAEHRHELDALADALVTHETLDEQEILAVIGLSRAGTILPLPTGMAGNNGHATLTPSMNERSN